MNIYTSFYCFKKMKIQYNSLILNFYTSLLKYILHFTSKMHFIKKKERTDYKSENENHGVWCINAFWGHNEISSRADHSVQWGFTVYNLSTFPPSLTLLLNNMSTCKRFRAVMMFVFSLASNKNYHFCVTSFASHYKSFSLRKNAIYQHRSLHKLLC